MEPKIKGINPDELNPEPKKMLDATMEIMGATEVEFDDESVSFKLGPAKVSPCPKHAFHRCHDYRNANYVGRRSYGNRGAMPTVGAEVICYMGGFVGVYKVLATDPERRHARIKKADARGKGTMFGVHCLMPLTRKNLYDQIITELSVYACIIEGSSLFRPTRESYLRSVGEELPKTKATLRELFAEYRRRYR